MSLADHFAECDRCSGYILGGWAPKSRLSSICRCDELTEQVERELLATMKLQPRKAAA